MSTDSKILSVVFDILIYCFSSYFPLDYISDLMPHCLKIEDFCILCFTNQSYMICEK